MASVTKDTMSSNKMNPDIEKERSTATFDVKTLMHYLNGGADKYNKKVEITKILMKDPVMDLRQDNSVSDVECYALAFKRTTKLLDLSMEHGWSLEEIEVAFQAIRVSITIGVHGAMFIPAIESLSTPEQAAEWLPKAYSLKMLGTYAQTELGHGTNLRGLETTATYDATTQEFVLNTPLPSGMKWWPGGLGKTCNHVLLLASLRIGSNNHGMQAFLVKIRDMDTHQPLPGVEVGEIGPRVGLKYTDNGFLILRNVRIPRTNMLMKNAQVTPDGRFISNVSNKATYGTMVMMRARIVGWAYGYLSQAATIATRYSAVRRQSELKPGSAEPQVMDYITQQYKVFPAIADSYAIFFAKEYIMQRHQQIYEQEMKQNNFKSLPELHSISCGLKAFCSDLSVWDSEICRRSCGGHGYLLSSGIAQIVLDSMASVTYEGENTVLYLQTARYVMREFSAVASGEQTTGTWAYLSEKHQPCIIRSTRDCDNLVQLTNAFKRMAYYVIGGVAKQLQALLESGVPQYEAWNKMSVHLVQATKVHVETFMALNFLSSVDNLPLPQSIQVVLRRLCVLYCLHRITENSGYFLESGALNNDQVAMIRQREVTILDEIRPDAVALVDAFGHIDETLNSALGSYDGQAYDRLYQAAKSAAVNKYEVVPGFKEHMTPFQSKL